jgi:hypothetical protein
MHKITLQQALFSKSVHIEDGFPTAKYDEELEITIGDDRWDRFHVSLQWDDKACAYFVEYVCKEGYRKREQLGVEQR